MKPAITVETVVHAPIEKIWEFWTDPIHIVKWSVASPDWHVPHATNDLRVGGQFLTRMEAKDGSVGFDFTGTYTFIDPLNMIEYTIGDGRKVTVNFLRSELGDKIVATFETENENPLEMQRKGWQTILDNFHKYVMGG